MLDVLYFGLACGLFAGGLAYALLCDRL